MRALIARYNVRVFRYVVRIVTAQALADDLINEIFFVAWRRAHQYEARAKVSTWLLSIARFKAMSALRQRRAHEDLDQAHDVADPTENAEVARPKADRVQFPRLPFGCVPKVLTSIKCNS